MRKALQAALALLLFTVCLGSGLAADPGGTPLLREVPAQPMANPPSISLSGKNGPSAIPDGMTIIPVTYPSETPSPLFRYPGMLPMRADWDGRAYTGAWPDRSFVRNTAVTTTNSFGNMIVEFAFTGYAFEIREKGQGSKYRLLVDEGSGYKVVPGVLHAAPADGALYYRKVAFADNLPRNIRIEYSSGYFGGIRVHRTDKVTPVARPEQPRAVIFGDSITESAGTPTRLTGYAPSMCWMLGWECFVSGVGGTGYLNVPKGRVKLRDRLANDVVRIKPDIVFIAAGNNDGKFEEAAIREEALRLYRELQAALPEATVIVASNLSLVDATETHRMIRDAVRAAALEAGLPFIDTLAGTTYDASGNALIENMGQWIYGSGTIDEPSDYGNSSLYTLGDRGHPTQAGHDYLAKRYAAEVLRLLAAQQPNE